MSNVSQTCLGRAGSLGPGRLGQWLYQTGHWDEAAFVNEGRYVAHGASPIATSISHTYNGSFSAVDFYAGQQLSMSWKMVAVAPTPPQDRDSTSDVFWQTYTPPTANLNYNNLDQAIGQSKIPVNPNNIGTGVPQYPFGWFFSRGLWRFDITVYWNPAMISSLDPDRSRDAELLCRGHRYYSTGNNRDQVLHTWSLGEGGATAITITRWLHVLPYWDVWLNVGAEYSAEVGELPASNEVLITAVVNAERLSPPANPNP